MSARLDELLLTRDLVGGRVSVPFRPQRRSGIKPEFELELLPLGLGDDEPPLLVHVSNQLKPVLAAEGGDLA